MSYRAVKIYLLLTGCLGLGLLVSSPTAQASGCSQKTTINFVADNPSGGFIPNANVTVYNQATDANGDPKPGSQVASANTDATVGTATLSWTPTATTSSTYVVRVRTISSDAASFWYYDNSWSCGQTASLTETLSGILFALHDENGNLLTNTGFNVYSQIYSGGKPTKQLQQSIAGLNSGSSGQTTAYLPQGSVRSLAKTVNDVYALDLSRNGFKFDYYNIAVTDGALSTVNYAIPAISVRLQDSAGALYPKGTNVVVFKQTVDTNNLEAAGSQVGSFTLGDGGSGTMEIPTGLYVLGVKNQSGTYQYFWNIQVSDGQSNNYDLTATSTPSSTTNLTTSCQTNSQLTLTVRTVAGQIISGLHFALYVQGTDANGLPTAGSQVSNGTLNSASQGVVSLQPDPRKIYALKIWDKNSNLGAFWFYGAVRFTCSNDLAITETIPAFTVTLRDGQGELLRNYNFSLYAQRYDADKNPYFQSGDLVAGLQTDGSGQAITYVAPYNSYVSGQTGIYAVSLKDTNNNTENFYNLKPTTDKDYAFSAALSGLSGELRNPESQLLANKTIELYSEKVSSGLFVLGQKLLSVKTDSGGQFQFAYPAGAYALVTYDDFNRQNIFWNIAINSGSTKTLTTSLTTFNLSDPQGQGLGSNPVLQLYSLSGSHGTYYRNAQIGTVKLTNNTATMSLAAGAYLAYYSGSGNQAFGRAFYAQNGSAYTLNIAVNSKYLVTTTKTFYLSGVPTNAAPATAVSSSGSSSSASSSSSSSLSATVKGRILLQVEDKGQAWYVSPVDGKRYSLGSPPDAFNVMRRLALGVSNANFTSIQNSPSSWKNLAGRILLKTEDGGKAYYFDPTNSQLYYLGRPQDAFNVMRTRGLGITNSNLTKISLGQ
jgi:hypothetical protein